MVWKMYMLSNKCPNPSWWTEIRKEEYGLTNVYAFKQVSRSRLMDSIRIDNYGLKNVHALKQVSESGLVDRNKNRQIWFEKCICFQTSIQILAGGPK